MNREQLKNEIREAIEDMISGIKLVAAVIEVEYPGCGYLTYDVLAEEVEKIRKKPEPEQGDTCREKSDCKCTCEAAPRKSMTFGMAIEAMKAGHRLAREGWNGKGMWVVYRTGYPDGIPCNKNTADAVGIPEGSLFKVRPYLQMKCVDDSFQMWLASQSDMLAEDWYIVE